MGCASSKPKKKKHHFGTNLVVERNKSVESDYKIIKRIGKGSIGIIYLAESRRPKFFDTPGTTSGSAAAGLDASWATRPFHNNNNNSDVLGRSTTSKNSDGKRQYAIKEIDTKMIDVRAIESLKTEIRILKNLDHPFIIKIFGSYTSVTKDREKLSVVMELCTGGTLDMYVPFKESVAKVLVANIVEAVLYLHNQNVIHRDLKNENVMFVDEDKDPNNIRLLDFGLAKIFSRNTPIRDRAGTIYTMSPEALLGDYNEKADMWSIGVMTYHLLSGERPFWGDTKTDIARKVTSAKYSMEGDVWAKISKEAKLFIRVMLQSDPVLRSGPTEALKSPWLRKHTESNIKTLSKNNLGVLKIVQDIDVPMKEMQKLALYAIAHKARSEHISKLREWFLYIDADRKGGITLPQMKRALEGEFSEVEIENWFQRADIDESGIINFTEFVASSLGAQANLSSHDIIEAFRVFDRDDTGYISADNLREALQTDEGEYIDNLIKDADEAGDGKISFQEFRNLLIKNRLRSPSVGAAEAQVTIEGKAI